jgi:dihydroorotate dehydrogenase
VNKVLTGNDRIFAPMYRLFRTFFFFLSAETAHTVAMRGLKICCAVPLFRKLLARHYTRHLPVTMPLWGLTFRNPAGLGAGFDKNAHYLRELEALGFGFVEIGTVTPRPQPGNDKPRLFRLPADEALINRMGFNNEGVEAIVERLKKWRTVKRNPSVPQGHFIIGGNIGKNKATPNEEAWKDYEICFRALHPYVDFFVVNVSSPNTPGLRALQEKEALKRILTHLQEQNNHFKVKRPILLKIAPDLTWEQVDDVIELARDIKLDGLVATNTTIERAGLKTPDADVASMGAGGLSGKPLKERSTQMVRYLADKLHGEIPIIASGGVFTATDAQEKLQAGAALFEVWTGFIYEGPGMVKRIVSRLRDRL